MKSKQPYEKTEKGRQARKRALANYKAKLFKWEVLLPPEMNDALEKLRPAGVSKQAFAKKIFQEWLDNICIQDT